MTYMDVGDDGMLCDLAGGWCAEVVEDMVEPRLLGFAVAWMDEVGSDDGTVNLLEAV